MGTQGGCDMTWSPETDLIVYIDVKSPFAYLAMGPTRALAKEYGISPVWRPYTLEIPDFLGAVETRNEHQWRRVRYSYMDARRIANRIGLTVRGPQKIFDSSIAHIGMLRAQDHGRFEPYIDRVFERFFKRELEIEEPAVIASVLEEARRASRRFCRVGGGCGPRTTRCAAARGGRPRRVRRAELYLPGRAILGRRPSRNAARTDRSGALAVI